MYAVIDEGGKQQKVTVGEVIDIGQIVDENTKTVTFDRVLLIAGEGTPRIGTPTLAGATVTAEVIRVFKGPKIDIVKYKRRKGYHKKQGHRQTETEVKITAING